jgi:hypothetical protein
MYKERIYRRWVKGDDLVTFEVVERETDLLISCERDLSRQARAFVLNYRKEIEEHIKKYPEFYSSLQPVAARERSSEVVEAMLNASKKAGVGPMAAVAGAIAEFVGRDLSQFSKEVIVENGGDIFIRSSRPRRVGVFSGESPFSGKLAIEIGPCEEGLGVCTSSGTVSHSLSFGMADAALVISNDTALADAVATATGNKVNSREDIEGVINFAKSIEGVRAVLIIVKDAMGTWGEIKLV